MKQYSRLIIYITFLILSLCILPQFANAVGSPGDDPGDPGGDPDAPIDGGVSILIAAGVLYGIKRIKDERKNKMNL